MDRLYSFSVQESETTSERVEHVRELFALEDDATQNRLVLAPTRVPTEGITYITGYSGAGK